MRAFVALFRIERATLRTSPPPLERFDIRGLVTLRRKNEPRRDILTEEGRVERAKDRAHHCAVGRGLRRAPSHCVTVPAVDKRQMHTAIVRREIVGVHECWVRRQARDHASELSEPKLYAYHEERLAL